MTVQEQISLDNSTSRHTRATKRWLIACICMLVVLVSAVASLIIYHTLTVNEHQIATDALASQIGSLESQVGSLESQQAENSSQLEAQQNTISDQELKLQEKESELKKQQDTISSLQAALASKKAEADGKTTQGKTTLTKTTVPLNGDGTGKLVALTFDDGPGPYTARLMDAMKERGVRATFFVLGSRVDKYQSLIRRMEAEGHVVANHSQNHNNLVTLSSKRGGIANVRNEMNACAEKLNKILGHYPAMIRCPGGNLNKTVKDYAREAGVSIIQWDVDTRDWESRNVKSILNKTFSGNYRVQDGSIVLMHDIYSTTVDAAIQMMDRLAKEGYTMVTVPELLTARKGGAMAGEVYNSAYKQK